MANMDESITKTNWLKCYDRILFFVIFSIKLMLVVFFLEYYFQALIHSEEIRNKTNTQWNICQIICG